MSSFRLTRKQFLQGATTALALLAGGFGFKKVFSPVAEPASGSTGDTISWKTASCSGCHQPTCATLIKVVNGVAMEIKGDPASATNRGRLCPRGQSIIMSLYNPYRVKTPLKRTNPRKSLIEDPGWVEISWEEALNTVSNKLKEAKQEDPRSFVHISGFGNDVLHKIIPFAQAFGTPNNFGTPGVLCPEHFSSLHLNGAMLDRMDLERCNYVVVAGRTFGAGFAIASGSTSHFMDAVERGMKVVSVSPVSDGQAQSGQWVPILPGTDAAFGMALLYTIIHEVGKYDEHFLKIRSNAPYLIRDRKEKYKESEVYMEDYCRDTASGKPLVWSEKENRAVPFDHEKGDHYALTGSYEVDGQTVKPIFQVLKDYIKSFTPEWAQEITTIPAKTIREIANDLVKEAQIGATVEIDGFTFPYRPACINIGRGSVTNILGVEAYKALGTVNVLLGNLDVPGGMQGCSSMSWTPLLQPDRDGVLTATQDMANQVVGEPLFFPPDRLDMQGFYPQKHATPHLAWRAVNSPDDYYIEFPAKVLMVHGANPIASNGNPDEVVEAFARFEFVISIAYHFDEPTQLADIVLPEHHSLEHTNIYRLFRNEKDSTDECRGMVGTFVKKAVVSPSFNTKDGNDIKIELARRAGFLPQLNTMINEKLYHVVYPSLARGLTPDQALEPHKMYTWEEIVLRKIKSDFGPDTGFEDFAASSFKPYFLPTIKESYNYYYAPENAVRLPVYYRHMVRNIKELIKNLEQYHAVVPRQDMQHFIRHYSGLPIWYKPGNYGVTPEYPFKAVNWKVHYLVNNTLGTVENPWLQETIDRYVPSLKSVLIAFATAHKLGLNEGDEVWVESAVGKTKGTVHLSHLIHPQCIGIGGNFGRRGLHMNPKAQEGPQFNILLPTDEASINPVMGNIDNSPQVKIYKV